MTDKRDEHVAFLVNEVGFTPEQAADATSDGIDRNGAAATLPGIIEALEGCGVLLYDEDELIESGVDMAEGHGSDKYRDKHRPGLVLTALKLLARAREAEAKVHALTTARHGDATAHSQDLADLAADVVQYKKMLSEVHSRVAPELVFRPTIDPTVAALAIVDDLETNGDLGPCAPLPMPPTDDGSPDAKDRLRVHAARLAGRAAQVERLAKVIASVIRRDTKPANPFPLWCAMEAGDRDLPFHGPHETEDDAEREAAERRDDGRDVRLLDALLEVDAYEVEPEGATP